MSMKPHEFRKKLKGVIHLVLTPFDGNGDLDEKALRLGLQKVVRDCKNEDVVILTLGTTGEFYSMNEAENRRVVDTVIDEIDGVFPVMVGTGRAGTRYTIETSKYAQQAGADGVLLIHPYYVMPTEEDLIHHYEDVAAALDIGICIYNNSTTSKLWLNPPIMKRLSKVENIVGLKENTSNPMVFLDMMQTLDENDITIIAGLGHAMFQFMCLFGCAAYVTELLGFAPNLALNLYKAGLAKDIPKIRENVDKIELLWAFIRNLASRRTKIPSILTPDQTPAVMPYYQAVNKAAMDLTGTPAGKVRAPMSNLTKSDLEELKRVLIQMGCTLA